VRVYQARPVEKEKLSAILEAVRAAPSAGNLQAFEVIVIESQERKAALARAALDQQHVAGAPVLLVFVADPARSASKYGGRAMTSTLARTPPSPAPTRSSPPPRSGWAAAGSARSTPTSSARS